MNAADNDDDVIFKKGLLTDFEKLLFARKQIQELNVERGKDLSYIEELKAQIIILYDSLDIKNAEINLLNNLLAQKPQSLMPASDHSKLSSLIRNLKKFNLKLNEDLKNVRDSNKNLIIENLKLKQSI